jgi:hypothetical protein
MKLQITKLALAALIINPIYGLAKTNEVDALILYSDGAADTYKGDAQTRINHLIATTNKIYKDSGLDIKLNAVKIQKYSISDSINSRQALLSVHDDAKIAKLRDEVGADEVIIYRPYANDGSCGLAYQNNYLNNPKATWVEKYAYAHVTIDCGSYVTAHEVGHNMGLGHSAKQNSTGAYPYARGHGEHGEFTTIMAYESSYDGHKIYKFSSPKLDCKGAPCGIKEGYLNEADAVKALGKTVPLVAGFRKHKIDNKGNRDIGNSVDENSKELDQAKKDFLDQKAVVQDSRDKLKQLINTFKDKKVKFEAMKKAFKAVRVKYIEARKDYRSRKISRSDFISLRSEYIEARKVFRKYITEDIKPLFEEYKKQVQKYRTEVKKLKELKKYYQDLKKSKG